MAELPALGLDELVPEVKAVPKRNHKLACAFVEAVGKKIEFERDRRQEYETMLRENGYLAEKKPKYRVAAKMVDFTSITWTIRTIHRATETLGIGTLSLRPKEDGPRDHDKVGYSKNDLALMGQGLFQALGRYGCSCQSTLSLLSPRGDFMCCHRLVRASLSL